jgi:glutamate dehydrogenase
LENLLPDSKARKRELVHEAGELAGELVTAVEGPGFRRVLDQLYQHMLPADIIERSPCDLCRSALSLWRFAEHRSARRAKIRVYNPDLVQDRWASPCTIVEIVNDDMPFLVDSISLAINASGRGVHQVTDTIVTVARKPDGQLEQVHDSDAPGLHESWIQIEISRESDHDDLARLVQTLSGILADVRVVVEDWQPMRERLRELVDEISRTPTPPVRPTDLYEIQDFLRWLHDDNFTFLGYREYMFDGAARPLHGQLGILRDEAEPVIGSPHSLSSLPSDVQDFIRHGELLVITKSNRRATVHRTAHMDAIGLRRFAPNGEVVGIRLFLGLFTSRAYSADPGAIPLLRLKVRRVIERAGLAPTTYRGKALLDILETFPRDELFQTDTDHLFETVIGILNLQRRQRIALFVRRDPLERFVSCLVYVPRDRYDSALRNYFAAILEEAFAGQLSSFYTHLGESPLSRIQFIIRTNRGAVPAVDNGILEKRLADAGRSWSDRLEEAATATFGEEEGRIRLRRLGPYPIAYQARTEAAQAIADLRHIEAALAGSPVDVSLHPSTDGGLSGLRIYRANEPVILSDVMPIFEDLSLRVVAEEPFLIHTVNGGSVWIHEYALAGGLVATGTTETAIAKRLAEAAKRWLDRGKDIHYSCFISYSSKDKIFAEQLHADLRSQGVRCWFAPHDLPTGAKIWDAIDEAIRVREKLLIILSGASIASDWVEDEVTRAYAEERERGTTVLFPIRIDDVAMVTTEPWVTKLRHGRNIADFQRWKEPDEYQSSLGRLLRDLKA